MMMRNNFYLGNAIDKTVKVNGKQLPLRLEVRSHSPDGFDWGNDGEGAAQLALAILCNEFGDDLSVHPVHYQDFKNTVIAHFNSKEYFEISTAQILDWMKQVEKLFDENRDAD